MKSAHTLWRWLGLIFVLSFGALGYLGWQIYLSAPPIPKQVVTSDGDVLYTGEQIQLGQQAWPSAGGQQLGTVWGHGAYVAPDWSADWLHREAMTLQTVRTEALRKAAPSLTEADRAAVETRVRDEMRRNTYDETSGTLKVSSERALSHSPGRSALRRPVRQRPGARQAARPVRDDEGVLPSKEYREALTAFFFWSAWATSTDRPGETGLSYTSNWPHEPLVGNTMTTSAAMWSMASIILLLAGIAAMLWLHKGDADEGVAAVPKADPLLGAKATPSMKATRKYFFVVIGLMLLQIGMGAITAHYAVEGQAFGIPLAQVLPYTISRTIHTQIGVF
jgi:nitric oxide reductase subunit B